MPEDQGVNGDRWTDQASRLFKKAGWDKIADSNIDVPGVDGLQHGIDALFCYEDGFSPKMKQGVFLEAKRYAVGSFQKQKLSDWVVKLDEKIRKLRTSQEFLQTYPYIGDAKLVNGVLAIWFHDLNNHPEFREKFVQYLAEVDVPRGRGSKMINLRLFILDNDKILRLASLLHTVEQWNKDNCENSLKFYYPSSARFGNSVQEMSTLNLEYIFSQFILAKAKITKGNNHFEVVDVVFYFGRLDINSFFRLREALLAYDMINQQNSLVIYKYLRESDNFRKIHPDVMKLFQEKYPKEVSIKDMETFNDLPTWMINE
jgi:hypothetical protein